MKAGPTAMRVALILIVGAMALAGVGVGYLTHTMAASPAVPAPIVVGLPRLLSSVPVYIAVEQGFFRRHGLNVTLREYDTGLAAATGVQRGQIDLALSDEFALVQAAFANESLCSVGSVSRSELVYLVGRLDRGVANASDLGGKRVGVPRHTVSEFYLSRFAALHGRGLGGVTLVDVSRTGGVEAICNGSIDAVVTAEPFLSAIRARLGDDVAVLPVQNSQYAYALLVTRETWLGGHALEAGRFLQGLRQADDWIEAHPAEAKRGLRERLGMGDPQLDAEWGRHQFSLSLDQSLILAMEDEGRWMIRNNLTDAGAVPDYRRYLAPGPLARVSPGSVTLVG